MVALAHHEKQRTPTESAVAPPATVHNLRPAMDEASQKVFLDRVALNRSGHHDDVAAGQ